MVWAPENLFKRHLPFVLLTGFLGSGKTTLLNKVLRDPRMENTAVAINEFGDIALDQSFIAAATEDVIVLANGCMCCLATDDLARSLENMLERGQDGSLPEFKRLIIETSGLANPEMVIQSIVDNPIAARFLWLDRIVTTVDAIYGLEQLEHHPEALKQASLADRIVISKADLVDTARLQSVEDALANLNPRAEIVVARQSGFDAARLFSQTFFDENRKSSFIGSWVDGQADLKPHAEDCGCRTGASCQRLQQRPAATQAEKTGHKAGVTSVSLFADEPLDWRLFSLWLGRQQRAYGSRLLRMKGIINAEGSDQPVVIHAVQSTLHVPVSLEEWPDGDRRTRIVFILQDAPETELCADWEEFVAELTKAGGATILAAE